MISKARTAGQLIGRTSPYRPATERLIEPHQTRCASDGVRRFRARAQRRIGKTYQARIGPYRYREPRAMIEQILREVDMSFPGIETGIDMGKADGHKAVGTHDFSCLDDEAHGEP